jgi:hypothetical protein
MQESATVSTCTVVVTAVLVVVMDASGQWMCAPTIHSWVWPQQCFRSVELFGLVRQLGAAISIRSMAEYCASPPSSMAGRSAWESRDRLLAHTMIRHRDYRSVSRNAHCSRDSTIAASHVSSNSRSQADSEKIQERPLFIATNAIQALTQSWFLIQRCVRMAVPWSRAKFFHNSGLDAKVQIEMLENRNRISQAMPY